ncbi:MAG: NnrS family protein [Sphingomonadales bacterium]
MGKADHIPVPRYRPFGGATLFAHGFRPFFLAAALWAPVALLLFLGVFLGWTGWPALADPMAWHHHELLFGFVAAAVAGFALTAIPNWTGRLPLQGAPLMVLAGLWLAGRAAMLLASMLPAWLVAVVDLAFLSALLVVAGREILAGRNWRNLPIMLAIGLFLLAHGLAHADLPASGLAHRLAIAVIITLIALIGGRIIPSFTHNWLVKQQAARLPVAFNRFDRLCLALTGLALLAWTGWPDSLAAALMLAAATLLNALRLARWQGWRTGANALLWMLHVSYAWVPLGLALLAASHWLPERLSPTAGIHALTAGAMAGMILAVMSRATLGHTGRALQAGPGLTTAYALILLAALMRVLASVLNAAYLPLLLGAALAWLAAFGLFLTVCGPMLLRPRVA